MLLYTNIGLDNQMTQQLIDAGGEKLSTVDSVIAAAHQRGGDELIHRSIKGLAEKEQLHLKSLT